MINIKELITPSVLATIGKQNVVDSAISELGSLIKLTFDLKKGNVIYEPNTTRFLARLVTNTHLLEHGIATDSTKNTRIIQVEKDVMKLAATCILKLLTQNPIDVPLSALRFAIFQLIVKYKLSSDFDKQLSMHIMCLPLPNPD